MQRRKCTAYTGSGNGKRCGRRDWCTNVRTLAIQWQWAPLWLLGLPGILWWHEPNAVEVRRNHWVCSECRERMRLPDEDVDFTPGVVPISEHVEVREPEPERKPFVLPGLAAEG